MPVETALPFHGTVRGSPTLTEMTFIGRGLLHHLDAWRSFRRRCAEKLAPSFQDRERTRPDGGGYVRRYSSGSLTTGGSSSWSSSSSSLGSRGGELLTRVQLTNHVETFSGMRGVMSAPVWMLRHSRGY